MSGVLGGFMAIVWRRNRVYRSAGCDCAEHLDEGISFAVSLTLISSRNLKEYAKGESFWASR